MFSCCKWHWTGYWSVVNFICCKKLLIPEWLIQDEPEDSRGQKLNTPICSVERLTAIMHIMVAVKLLLSIVKGQDFDFQYTGYQYRLSRFWIVSSDTPAPPRPFTHARQQETLNCLQ